jgi:hypothetical protein
MRNRLIWIARVVFAGMLLLLWGCTKSTIGTPSKHYDGNHWYAAALPKAVEAAGPLPDVGINIPLKITPQATGPNVGKVELKVLVMYAGKDPAVSTDPNQEDIGLPVWTSMLQAIGIPYDTFNGLKQTLTSQALINDDGVGKYNAIFLTNGALVYQEDATLDRWNTSLSPDEWNLLWQYERDYKVRQAALYIYPNYVANLPSANPEDYCLRYNGFTNTNLVGGTPVEAQLTADGQQVFDYLKQDLKFRIENSWLYRSKPPSASVEPKCAGTKVLLRLPADGSALAVTTTSEDGRERIATTFAHNFVFLPAQLMAYGMVRWATKGMFLGERHLYLTVDVDDHFNRTDRRLSNGTLDPAGFRISPQDFWAAYQIQQSLRSKYPLAARFVTNLAFNGDDEGELAGARPKSPTICDVSDARLNNPMTDDFDGLTSLTKCLSGKFRWLNHTLSHQNMDFVEDAGYAIAKREIVENNRIADELGITFPKSILKSGELSGLGYRKPNKNDPNGIKEDFGLASSNTQLLQAAKDAGIKVLHSNLSVCGQNPSPISRPGFCGTPTLAQLNQMCMNCGQVHPLEPSLFLVPVRPNGVAFFTTAPDEAVSYYNVLYGLNGIFPFPLPGPRRDFTYQEMVELEADFVLRNHLLPGAINSNFFHQGNLREYAAGKNLVYDWVERVLQKYSALYTLPLRTPSWHVIVQYVQDRNSHFANLRNSGFKVILDPASNTLSVSGAKGGALFVTGTAVGRYETYGSDTIARLELSNQAQTFNLKQVSGQAVSELYPEPSP